MMQQYMKELEQVHVFGESLIFNILIKHIINCQEPFDAEEFVERLAWRTIVETKKSNDDEDFNPIFLHDSFVQAIK